MSEPERDPLSKAAIERGTLRGIWRRIVRRIVLVLWFLLFRLRLKHVERVPRKGGILLVGNHIHNADPILLSAAYPEPVHFMCKKEAFNYPILKVFLNMVGAFPVDRGRSDRFAIKRALAALNNGIAVGMFPEGTRSRVFALQQAHPGAGMLALSAGAIVQPVAITGTERLPFNGAKGKATGDLVKDPGHPGSQILFGEPFRIPREIDGRRVTADEASEIMMIEIARLLPADYRGVYADKLAAETIRRAQPV
ncbi:MAG TPA: lysophospholipid acyltransferase family protein [Thermomicrobiales bacterium]|nr:lysophospholipid acyltransferase family protein [Thermomicrobiales bacterium]